MVEFPRSPSRNVVALIRVQIRKIPEINEEFAQAIRKDLTLEQLTMEVEKAVMEEAGTTKVDARNRCV